MSNEKKIYKVTVTREYVVEVGPSRNQMDLAEYFERPKARKFWRRQQLPKVLEKSGREATVEFQHLMPESCPET